MTIRITEVQPWVCEDGQGVPPPQVLSKVLWRCHGSVFITIAPFLELREPDLAKGIAFVPYARHSMAAASRFLEAMHGFTSFQESQT